MPKNPGNTGQRYKMPVVTSATLRGNRIVMTLSCGHSYEYEASWSQAFEYAQGHIGKRTRCQQCQAVSA